MHVQPISPPLLVEHLAQRIADGDSGGWTRVALDGARAAEPGRVADELVGALRLRGRAALHVSAWDFLRPASLRLEFGRSDPDVFYTEWLDAGGLIREVLGPLEAGGSGRVLPALWDAAADRAGRAGYVELPPGGVLLLSGTFLLSRPLPFELAVHFWMTAAALARRTAPDERWTLPAYARYEDEIDPVRSADVVVRCDDPARPALVGDL
ncbi:MAG TPA: uridine kinase [Actinocrinis sp.]|jgi:hypothetical protein